jgi:O-antigen/teichoic acid export membrane protein
MSETKRIFSGFVASSYSHIVTIFHQIILVPFFLSSWGTQYYGEWLVLIALPMYMSLSEVGVTNTAASEICMLAGKNKEEEVAKIYTSSWYLSVGFAVILAISLYLIFLIFEHIGIYKFVAIGPNEARVGFCLYTYYMFLTVVCAATMPIYKYAQKFPLSEYINNTTRLIEVFAIAITLMAKHSLLVMMLGMVTIRMIGFIVLFLTAKKIAPFISLKFENVVRVNVRGMIKPAMNYSLLSIAVNLLPQAFIIGLGNIFSSQVVVVYSMTKTLARSGCALLHAFTNSLRVELSHLSGDSGWDKVFKLIDKSSFYYLIFAIVYIAIGTFTADLIFKIWSGKNIHVDPLMFFIVSATSMIQAIWMLYFSAFTAVNRHAKLSQIYSAISLLSLVAAFCLPLPKNIDLYLSFVLAAELIMLAVLYVEYRNYRLSKQENDPCNSRLKNYI